MRAQLNQFATYCLIQMANYAVLTYNFRSIAAGSLPKALMSDGLNAVLTFVVIKKIANDNSWSAGIGYVVGSLIGTTFGMCL